MTAPRKLSEAMVREPLRVRLRAREPKRMAASDGTPAAVLVPLFERDGDVHVWLMRRPKNMRNHAGQVALPGGKIDATDASPLAAALREANEELGIREDDVDVLGALDDHITITRFVMTPHVAWLRRDVVLSPNADEVARVFAVPLATFLGEPTGTFPFRGFPIDGELVWGATSRVLGDLGTIVREIV